MTIQPECPQSEFMALWSEHAPRVYGYICSLVTHCADADDIFQETSVYLFEHFADFTPGTSFSAWACRVAYLRVLEALARRRLLDHVDERFLQAIDESARQLSEPSDRRHEALAQCVRKLPAKDRRLIELRYQHSSDVKAVAAKVRRSPSLIYKSLARIHDVLLACIRRTLAEGDRL